MTDIARVSVIADQYSDQAWRLNNLYKIVDKRGRLVPFRMNDAQLKLFEALWYRNAILKARQRGFTTLMCLYGLDSAIWNDTYAAGIIAHNLDDSEKIFRTKVRVPYENLSDQIKQLAGARLDRAREYVFGNGSSISVGTSFRSGTLQLLHVSEFGKIAAKYPDKAREILTGALEAVPIDGIAVFESTAEGNAGAFFDMVQDARRLADQRKSAGGALELAALEFLFHFETWWTADEYRLPTEQARRVIITAEDQQYFEKLEGQGVPRLSIEQRAWYVAKKAILGDDMLREYPSTPDEAFEVAVQGAYYAKEMRRARQEGRITRIPIETRVPVVTFWDLGRNDANAIWWMQAVGPQRRFIDYYENSGLSLQHYAQVLRERSEKYGYIYEAHYLPHDVEVVDISQSDNLSRRDVLEGYGVKPIITVARVENLNDGIEMTRQAFAASWFDVERCADGIKCLDNYRRAWDDKRQVFESHPLHDWASNGADAYRQYAQGYRQRPTGKPKPKSRGANWKTR